MKPKIVLVVILALVGVLFITWHAATHEERYKPPFFEYALVPEDNITNLVIILKEVEALGQVGFLLEKENCYPIMLPPHVAGE